VDAARISADRARVNASEALAAVSGIRLISDGITASMPEREGRWRPSTLIAPSALKS
jgi:hypothetical protein